MSNETFMKDNMVYEGTKTDNVGCSCGSLIWFFIIFMILGSVIAVAFLLLSDYNSWKNGFLIERDPTHVIYIEDILLEEQNAVDKLILDFSESKQKVDFIELTPYQVGIVMANSLAGALPDGVILDQVYIEPYERKWTIYMKTHTEKISLPWVGLEVKKDNVESAMLTVTGIYVGELSVELFGLDYLVDNVNEGYSDALILVNDNGFTGRRLDNIELGSDVIVIKGTLRDEPTP